MRDLVQFTGKYFWYPISGIVPFVTSHLKGQFVVLLKWLFRLGYIGLGYIGLGDCPIGARNKGKATVKIRRNAPLRGFYERDYT